MRIHWLIKYYLLAFTLVGLIVFYIETKEPYVNWNLYPNFKELEVKKIVSDKNCEKLSMLYSKEFNSNYEKNIFGFNIFNITQDNVSTQVFFVGLYRVRIKIIGPNDIEASLFKIYFHRLCNIW